MVVDDEEPITQLYEDVFEAEGIETIIFNSSELALDYFLQHQDDIAVIITDYTMPKLNGTDFIRAIRRKNDQVPVILCSGNADVLDREIFDEIGVTKFLAKPVNLMEISKLVSSFL
jgi:DNA-binding response OmpR family regulator